MDYKLEAGRKGSLVESYLARASRQDSLTVIRDPSLDPGREGVRYP